MTAETIICANCGLENRAVKKVCWNCRCDVRTGEPKLPSERNIAIFKAHQDGVPDDETAKRYGISRTRVRQIVGSMR